MSTHLHALLEHADPTRIVRRVRRELDATADRRGVARFDEPHIEVLSDAHAALRYAIYTHANPVKARMVTDPRAWALSSHRDVVGLRHARWYSPARLLALGSGLELGPSKRVPDWLHERAGGSPLVHPDRPEPLTWPIEPLDLIARSTRAVFGLTEDEWRSLRGGSAARHCFVVAAELRGWRRAEIAAYLGWTERHGRRVPPDITPQVEATLVVATDPCLRPTTSEWWFVPADARGPSLWREWWDSVHPELKVRRAAIDPRGEYEIPDWSDR
jgi:hypothetical protein